MPKPGGTTARGYGYAHVRARKAVAASVERGEAVCTRCFGPILPGQRWDLDHSDDRTTYLGPAHRGCNRSAGGRKANARRRRTQAVYGPLSR